MSKRKPDVYLQDILESIQHIEKYLEGVEKMSFIKIRRNKTLFFADWKSLENL